MVAVVNDWIQGASIVVKKYINQIIQIDITFPAMPFLKK